MQCDPDGDLRAGARRQVRRQSHPRESAVRLALQHLPLCGSAAGPDRRAGSRVDRGSGMHRPTCPTSTSSAATMARMCSRQRSTSTIATSSNTRKAESGSETTCGSTARPVARVPHDSGQIAALPVCLRRCWRLVTDSEAAETIDGRVRDSLGRGRRQSRRRAGDAGADGRCRERLRCAGQLRMPAPAPGTLPAHRAGSGISARLVKPSPFRPAGLRPSKSCSGRRRCRRRSRLPPRVSSVDALRVAAQPVNVITADEIDGRVKTVVAQAVEGEAGVHLQRTSPTMAGMFVRGLTGNKVNVFVDGVRYSNGAQRGGVNTFLDLIEPDAPRDDRSRCADPSSAQYGSDALGGSIQFFSRPPARRPGGGRAGADSLGGAAAPAIASGGGAGVVGYTGPSLGVTGTFGGRRAGAIRTGERHRFARGGDALSRPPFRRADGRAAARHRVPSGRRHPCAPTGCRSRTPASSPSLHAHAPGRRQALRPAARRRRQPDLRPQRPVARSRSRRASSALGVGWFDHASFTYSFNSQREERVNQGGNGNPTRDDRPRAGADDRPRPAGDADQAAVAAPDADFGGDVTSKGSTSESFNVNPATGADLAAASARSRSARPSRRAACYAQTAFDAVPDACGSSARCAYGGARYRAERVGQPDRQRRAAVAGRCLSRRALTFRAGAVITPDDRWTFVGSSAAASARRT